jgi:hypothetical protein
MVMEEGKLQYSIFNIRQEEDYLVGRILGEEQEFEGFEVLTAVSMKIKNSEGAKVMEKYLMVSKSRS